MVPFIVKAAVDACTAARKSTQHKKTYVRIQFIKMLYSFWTFLVPFLPSRSRGKRKIAATIVINSVAISKRACLAAMVLVVSVS